MTPKKIFSVTGEIKIPLKKLFSVKGEVKTPFHGIDGESAYETACRHGFTGSEAEWLESLHFMPDNTVRSWDPVTDKVSSPGEPDSPLAHFAEKNCFEFIRVCGSGETLPYDSSKYIIDGADGCLKNGDYVVWLGRWIRICVRESTGSSKKNSDGHYSSKSGVSGLMSSADKAYLTDLINVYWGKEKLPMYTTPNPPEGWQCNWLFDTGWYLGGIKKNCGGHPPVLNDNHTSYAVLVLNGMATDANSLNHNHRLQIAFDVINSRVYMRRGWMSENTWADKWEDVGKIADGSITEAMLSNDLKKKLSSSPSSPSAPASYTGLNITGGTSAVYSGENGLVKFTLAGQTKIVTNGDTGAYQPFDPTKTYVPLPHTKGTLVITDSDGNEKIRVAVPDLQGKNNISDTLTDEGLTRYYSDEFFPNSSFVVDEKMEKVEGTSWPCGIYTLKFPEAVFGDKPPRKNPPSELANIITPMMGEVTEDELVATKSFDSWYYGQKMSFAWHEDEKAYILKLLYVYVTLDIISNLFTTKWYFRYVLAEPEIKRNTPKLYMQKGDVISFVPDEGQYYGARFTVSAPDNEKASLEGISQLTLNVNDLNDRVENIEFSEAEVGYPDGSSDNSDVFQNLLDNNLDKATEAAGVITIPGGIYKLSKPLYIRNAGTHIKGGGGEVILWCEGAFPALIVEASKVTIEGLKIYVSKTESGAVPEENNGWHSGIYVNIYKGIYDLKIKDVDIQGAYRFSTRGSEYSYGIYIPDLDSSKGYGFNYFSFIDNVRCFSLYCGILIGNATNSVKANFYFDSGENIYNLPDFAPGLELFTDETINREYTDGCGSGYGAIINGNGNTIDFFGQCFGYDHITPHNIVVDNEANPTEILSCEIQNLTEAGIKVSGYNNLITGFASDSHRSDMGVFWFTNTSRANHYQNIIANGHYNNDSIVFCQTDSIYMAKYGRRIPFTHVADNGIVYDFGLENKPMNKAIHEWEHLVGSYKLMSVDPEGTANRTSFSHIDGMQDNSFAYIDKWGEVSVYRLKADGKKEYITECWQGNPSDNVTVADISQVFRPAFDVDDKRNFRSGVTFKEIPTNDDPIYIDILFSSDASLYFDELPKYQIVFNDYICKSFDMSVLQTNTDDELMWTEQVYYRTNDRAECSISDYNWMNGGHFGLLVRGIRLVLREGYSVGSYNPEGYVGLSLIFAYAGNSGGCAWLPRGGGRLYGDLDMNGNMIKLGMSKTLPPPSEEHRGKMFVCETEGGADKVYVCKKNAAGVYAWAEMG